MTRYNVITICADDTPPKFYEHMPYLGTWPNGSWVRFQNSWVTNPMCGPARCTMLNGRYSRNHGGTVMSGGQFATVGWDVNDFADGGMDPESLLPVALKRAGYKTAHIGKYINGYPWESLTGTSVYQPSGWDEWDTFRSTGYTDFTLVENGTAVPYSGAYSTDVLRDKATGWLDTVSEPFYLHFMPFAPHVHGDQIYADRHAALFDGEEYKPPNFNRGPIDGEPAWMPLGYPNRPWPAGTVANDMDDIRGVWRAGVALDEAIEAIVDSLTDRGILDQTVIFVVGDNGFLFREHGARGKQMSYHTAVDAVMSVRWPGATQRTVTSPVANIDLAPTIAAVAGVPLPIAPDGMDLGPLVRGEVAEGQFREAMLLEMPDMWMNHESQQWRVFHAITDGRWKYVEHGLDRSDRVLWDRDTDPYELDNLYDGSTPWGRKLQRLVDG